jgi:hypothetical protein
MSQVQDLLLINAAIEAAFGGLGGTRSIPPSGVTRRLFELVKGGERNFETLRAAALKLADRDAMENQPPLSCSRDAAPHSAKQHFTQVSLSGATSSCGQSHHCAGAQHPEHRLPEPAQ